MESRSIFISIICHLASTRLIHQNKLKTLTYKEEVCICLVDYFVVLFSGNILVVHGSSIQLMLIAYCTLIWTGRSRKRRSQWPRGLRRRSGAGRLLRSWVRIPPGAWIFVCCECWVLSGRGLCDELITRPEESYLLRCVVVCDQETSRMRRLWPALGRSTTGGKKTKKKQIQDQLS